jgi:PAS domain S-box-containing protein
VSSRQPDPSPQSTRSRADDFRLDLPGIEPQGLLQTILDSLPYQVYAKDAQGCFILANQGTAEALGTTVPALLGRTDFDFMDEIHAAKHRADDMEVMTTGRGSMDEPYYFTDETGAERWYAATKMPLLNDEGEAVGVVGINIEITDQRNAESALRAARERIEAFLRSADDLVYFRTPAGQVTMLNDAHERITGYFRSDFEADDGLWRRIVQPVESMGDTGPGYPVRAATGLVEVQYRLRTRQGDWRWIHSKMVPAKDETGKLMGHNCVDRDITAIKRSEEQLRLRGAQDRIRAETLRMRKREEVRGVLATLRAALAETGVRCDECSVTVINEDLGSLIVVTSDSVARRSLDDVEGLPASPIWKAWTTGRPVYRADLLADDPWSERPDLRDWAPEGRRSVLDLPFGRGVLGLNSHRPHAFSDDDMARIREFEPVLNEICTRLEDLWRAEESEDRYGAIFDAASDAILIVEGDRIADCNVGTLVHFGGSKADLVGRPVADLVCEPTREQIGGVLARARDGDRQSFECECRRVGGSTFEAEIGVDPVHFSHGIGLIMVVRDVSERKRTEAERKRIETQMQHAQKLESLGVLAGGIAHDFNNLLVGVLGNAALAQMHVDEKSPAHQAMEQIETAALRASDLAKQMLAYSGRGKFVVDTVDLSELVAEMVHLLRASISKKADLILDLADDLPGIEGDATQIRQVVMNLITNAADALGEEEGRIEVTTGWRDVLEGPSDEGMEGQGPEPGRYAHLQVRDTGCGMDADTRERIFEPFYTTKFAGRGLGLSAVLGIVRGHHGALLVESEPGAGTCFTVLFPVGEAEANGAPEPAKVEDATEWRGGGAVLVADDEETVRRVARMALEHAGFQVFEAADGAEAVQVYTERGPEIAAVLLDMTMPRLSGPEALSQILTIDPEARIILSSGYSEMDAREAEGGSRAAGFVQKPYRPSELLAGIRAALGAPE